MGLRQAVTPLGPCFLTVTGVRTLLAWLRFGGCWENRTPPPALVEARTWMPQLLLPVGPLSLWEPYLYPTTPGTAAYPSPYCPDLGPYSSPGCRAGTPAKLHPTSLLWLPWPRSLPSPRVSPNSTSLPALSREGSPKFFPIPLGPILNPAHHLHLSTGPRELPLQPSHL